MLFVCDLWVASIWLCLGAIVYVCLLVDWCVVCVFRLFLICYLSMLGCGSSICCDTFRLLCWLYMRSAVVCVLLWQVVFRWFVCCLVCCLLRVLFVLFMVFIDGCCALICCLFLGFVCFIVFWLYCGIGLAHYLRFVVNLVCFVIDWFCFVCLCVYCLFVACFADGYGGLVLFDCVRLLLTIFGFG